MTTTTTTTNPSTNWLFEIQHSLSSACLLHSKTEVIEGFVIDILRSYFAEATHIENEKLRKLIWSTSSTTGILIEPVDYWTPEMTAKRPALLVKRNAMNSLKTSIGNMRQGVVVDRAGDPHFSKTWVGSLTVFCICEHPREVDMLASAVQEQLDGFAPVILAAQMNLMKFEVVELGARSILEEAFQKLVIPVTLGFAYEQSWAVRQQRPLLKGVLTKLGCAE